MARKITGEEAAELLLRRRVARREMGVWCEMCGYVPAAHHRLIIRKLEAVARGEVRRLALFMPPGSAKSTYASILFPPWYLHQHPGASLMAMSHTAELAEKWGRRVRNLLLEHRYTLNIVVSEDNKAAGRWETDGGGEYYAAGVGGSIPGRRADLAIIDDPIRSREDADSAKVRDSQWDWYQFDLLPRLKPNASIVLITCLTGDTRIWMADGWYKRLDAIEVGDEVISWDGQDFVGSRVGALVDSGLDQTYLIRTSGTEIRANARHPFLVLIGDRMRWIRTKDLRVGMRIVGLGGALTEDWHAPSMDVTSLQKAGGCAGVTTRSTCGLQGIVPHLSPLSVGLSEGVSGDTGLMDRNTTGFSRSRVDYVPSARQTGVLEGPSTGLPVSVPIITTRRGSFEVSYATTATGSQDELEIPPSWSVPSSMSGPDTDVIVSIEPYAIERVYDLSVENTHCFVANGLWSHNTRWHEDDLAGRILEAEGSKWDVVSLPMEAGVGDPLGRKPGDILWPEWFTQEMMDGAKRDTRVWSALYQQEPSPETGDYFRAEWLRTIDVLPARDTLHVYGASDYAVTSKGGDYTVHVVVGVGNDDRMYVLDLWRGQSDSSEWIEAWCDLVRKWKPREWAEEGGQINAAVGPFLEKRARERGAYTYRRQFPSRHDKSVRAQSIRGRMATLGLYLPKHVGWRVDLEAELLRFPAGKHDDVVDSLSLIGQLLDTIRAPELAQDNVKESEFKGYSSWGVSKKPRVMSSLTL